MTKLNPSVVSSIYPRPSMKRDSYISLDGNWTLSGKDIRVPYPPESPASGYEGEIPEELIYERTFECEKTEKKLILHFGAVDEKCDVYVNGSHVGGHEGGYLPFSFDITEYINNGENILKVEAQDSLSHIYPYGKQKKNRGGMWYTPVSGIWQSVWLEEVEREYIVSYKTVTDMTGADIYYCVSDSDKIFHERADVESPELWTPENPNLYTYKLRYKNDEVEIYFALRTVKIEEIDGIKRITLNGKPIFLHGVLDQGYYPDGLFIPKDFSEIGKDVKRMKDLGFNMLRKHIKVEPEIYYYECDRQGMLILQDMPNSGEYSFFRDTLLGTLNVRISDRTGTDGKRKQFFISHSKEIIKHLENHPSVIGYTIFNEGWGQFESDYIYSELKSLAPDKLFDSTSGWFKQKLSDFDSEHIYFRTKTLKPKNRPFLLSECGGYTLLLEGHTYTEGKYGYGASATKEELSAKIFDMYRKMVIPGIVKGVCGCVYTQLSDIEDEINGFYTYDREEIKVLPDVMLEISSLIKNETEKIKI